MCQVYRDLDQAAECDLRLFWKLARRRKPRSTRIYSEIEDEYSQVHRDPNSVAEVVASYFEKIYNPIEEKDFDFNFKREVDTNVRNIMKECKLDASNLPGGVIKYDELTTIIDSLKLRKAPGHDSITNEHIIHGGKNLALCLLNIFNTVIACGSILREWKQGLIVPLYKGGDK
jgi:hypothetical protein